MSNLQNCTSLQEATGKLDYRLTNDCMFHVVFQKNPKALRGLCASLLHMRPEEIRSVEVLNPLEFKTLPTDKAFVLDLKVMLNDDRILNFEVQVVDEKDWPERSLTYACRTFDQLQKGQTYLDAKPVYHIGFLDYDIKDFSPEFYATYKLLNINNHEIYSDKFILSIPAPVEPAVRTLRATIPAPRAGIPFIRNHCSDNRKPPFRSSEIVIPG